MAASSPRLYFAYGSNLSPTQMALRCPSSVPVGLAHLAGYTFIINSRGYANVVRDAPEPPTDPAGPGVYGVLYTLSPADEATLDKCEGVPYAYQKHDLHVKLVPSSSSSSAAAAAAAPPASSPGCDDAHAVATALVYVDGERTAPSSPRAEYVGRMNRGLGEAAELFGLPAAYVDRVIRPYIPAPEAPIVGPTTAIADPFLACLRR
ncbi:AIG2-like family protein [Colletotrichum cereale]|nr:AIG2-like family protein [Colletotrichum cereale]